MLRNCLLLTCLLLCVNFITAQDANYWNNPFNAGGYFTPGAVVSFNRDSGVYFFNPALIALSKKSSATFSGTIYQFQSTKIKDATGTGKDLKSSGASIIPQMVAGSISLKGAKSFSIGYALINAPVINFQATQRSDTKQNVLNDSYSPGTEYYVGQYAVRNTIHQTTGMFSAALKLSQKLSFGISFEGHIRTQNLSHNITSRALENIDTAILGLPLVNAETSYNISYTHVGLKFKAGLAYDFPYDHFGLIITSPLVKIYGKSTLAADLLINNLRLQPTNLEVHLFANTRQTNLSTTYKTPVSIALGYTHDFDKSQVYISGEYFSSIKQYNVIKLRKDFFIRPDTNSEASLNNLLQLTDMHKSIINAAIGFSCALNKTTTGYISFATDFNYETSNLTSNDGFAINTSYWNNYHLQTGVNFKQRRINFRAGLLLTYGSTSNYPQQINFDDPNEDNILQGTIKNVKASYFSAGLVLSYIHNL